VDHRATSLIGGDFSEKVSLYLQLDESFDLFLHSSPTCADQLGRPQTGACSPLNSPLAEPQRGTRPRYKVLIEVLIASFHAHASFLNDTAPTPIPERLSFVGLR
jgi:hypothetical protein